jgi:hypothetical protein
MSKIQSAATGDEKLSSGGWLAVADEDTGSGFGRDLRRPESGRASADYCQDHFTPASAHKFFSCR